MRLRDQVVFITDADSPSGQAIIHKLSAEGAHLILNSDSGGQAIQELLAQCQKNGSKVIVEHMDVCSIESVVTLLDTTADQLGDVDILVHNHNVVRPASVETCEESEFQEMLRMNAKSAFITTQAVGRRMAVKQSGRIIYVSSIHSEKPTGSSFLYSASKGAVQMLSREASLALGRSGVNVNNIQMGPVDGDNIVFQSEISGLYDDYEYKVPSAVLGTFNDLADLVLYLSSDESKYINGADIRIDGGFLHHYLDVRTKKPFQL